MPPVIGNDAVVPASVAGPMMPGVMPWRDDGLERGRVERERGRALGQQLGLGRHGADADLAEREALLEGGHAERAVERARPPCG